MAELEYNYIFIAQKQLHTALILFFEGNDFFSSAVLAKSAENIFGQELDCNEFEQNLKNTEAMYWFLFKETITRSQYSQCVNRIINRIRHGREDGLNRKKEGALIKLDAKKEAEIWIDMAITNYWNLEHKLTVEMQKFIFEQISSNQV